MMEATYSLEPSDSRKYARHIAVWTTLGIVLAAIALFPDLTPAWNKARFMEGFIALGCATEVFARRKERRAAESSAVMLDDEGIWRAGADRLRGSQIRRHFVKTSGRSAAGIWRRNWPTTFSA